MRFLLVATLVGLCALASSLTIDQSHFGPKQKDVWRLFKYITQPSHYKDHMDIAASFNIESSKAMYMKPEVVEEWLEMYKYMPMLQRGEIFSIFYEAHQEQAIALFKLFYYAKDWDTLYKTAVWARTHLNEGIFLYSFSVALIHREDTYKMVLPPIYEIYPNYFFSSEVIQKAQEYKQLYNGANDAKYNQQTIYANYSGYYLNLQPEQSLSYFTEDVGINAFYYYYNLYYPFWMDGQEFKLQMDKSGELFYFMYQQILARYYLERLSNDMGEIPSLDYNVPLKVGYTPSLRYPNGLEFPTRPNYANLYEYFYNYGQNWNFKSFYGYSYTIVMDMERRIRDAIDLGFVFTKTGDKVSLLSEEGVNVLGNMMQTYPESQYYQYYGAYQIFARHLLGYSMQPLQYNMLYPSAMEHFETSMRDPVFYMLYKKIIMMFMKQKYQNVKPYKYDQLVFNGVSIKNVEFDELITFMDMYYYDLSNAVLVTPEEFQKDSFKVQVGMERLAYKPFTYKIHVESDKAVDATVKVFLGPKYDEYGRVMNLTENWMNFVQFDHFTYKLKSGENMIMRNSEEIVSYMHDRATYLQKYKEAFGTEDLKMFKFAETQMLFGFPKGWMLPMGMESGMPYQFFVIVSKLMPKKEQGTMKTGMEYVCGYPMGYPFNRPIFWEKMFYDMPNTYFYETKIFNKDIKDVGHMKH